MLINKITPRQLEFISEVGNGLSIVDVADKFFLNKYTVRNTLKSARAENGARSNNQLLAWCIKDGFLKVRADGSVEINRIVFNEHFR